MRSCCAWIACLWMLGCQSKGHPVDTGMDGAMPAPDAGPFTDAGTDAALPSDAAVPLDGSAPDGGGPPPIDWRFEGGFIRAAHPLPARQWLVVIEAPLHLHTEWGKPRRELRWLTEQGAEIRTRAAPPDHQLLDVAVHGSGDMTLLLASDAGYSLLRLTSSGVTLGEQRLSDPHIGDDPPLAAPEEPTDPIGPHTHDTGRIAALGEDVVLAARNARNAVVAYRFAWTGDGFDQRYRTLVEPALRFSLIGLTGGSYDTFGLVQGQFTVHLAVDADGLAYVGVRYPEFANGRLERLHQMLFGETLTGDIDFLDVFVTRIAGDGTRLGTSIVTTPRDDQLYGLQAFEGGAYVLGRNERWNAEGTGFDALIATVDASTGAVSVREEDVAKGDVAFDSVPVPGDGVLVVGASGYTQNPRGASISERCDTFARWLRTDGTHVDVPLPNGPRHSEARFVRRLDGRRFVVGSMLDGPGTHSADRDPSLLRARGFLVEVTL